MTSEEEFEEAWNEFQARHSHDDGLTFKDFFKAGWDAGHTTGRSSGFESGLDAAAMSAEY